MRALLLCGHELRRATRSLFLIGMGIVAPLGISGIIAVAMSGAPADGEPADHAISVAVHGPSQDAVVQALSATGDHTLLQTTVVASPDDARAAVREERAAVAVLVDDEGRTAILHDPTLKVAPAIVAGVVRQVRDAQRGAAVAVSVVAAQHPQRPVGEVTATVGAAYASFMTTRSAAAPGTAWPAFTIENPRREGSSNGQGFIARLTALILAAQIVFFSFFGGGYAAESLLRDIEEGTFARLRTFPVTVATLLLGKASYVFVVVALQVATLLAAGAALFDVAWGSPLRLALAAIGLIVLASGFGLLVISFARTRKQAGAVLGGVMTLLGALGGLFTVGVANLPTAFNAGARLTPHGLAMFGFRGALDAGPVESLAANAAACVLVGALCFVVGVLRFARREG